MFTFLSILQIFVTIFVSLFIVFQKSNNDNMIIKNINNPAFNKSHNLFANKCIMFLVFIFITNSLLLSKYSMQFI